MWSLTDQNTKGVLHTKSSEILEYISNKTEEELKLKKKKESYHKGYLRSDRKWETNDRKLGHISSGSKKDFSLKLSSILKTLAVTYIIAKV